MQTIPLIRRLLLYGILFLISFVPLIFGGILREYGRTCFIIYMFLIPHYIFGLIFLKTKWILKLIVPFVTAFISFGVLWLIINTCFLFSFDMLHAFIFIIVWEIVYQILKCKKMNQHKI